MLILSLAEPLRSDFAHRQPFIQFLIFEMARNSPSVTNRASMTERNIAEFQLDAFQPESSRAAQRLRVFYPHGDLTRRALCSFATVLAVLAGVTLPRDLTRRRNLLMKWFDDHFDALEPYLQFFELDPN
jgi:hypothetical protein